jgi:hypothetical protein
MAFCEVEKVDGYTIMANYHLRDRRLSLKAKGLLSMIFSLPPDWDMSVLNAQIQYTRQFSAESCLAFLLFS